MMNIEKAVAENARRLRRERGLTIDEAARRSGVSKSMISQIENGSVNPTVSLLANLAAGYRVPLTDLLTESKAVAVVVRASDLVPEEGAALAFRISPIYPFDAERRLEVYRGEAEAGAELVSAGHTPGSMEFVMLTAGRLVIEAAGGATELAAGDSLRFDAAGEHVYRNTGRELAVFIGMVSYGFAGRPEGAL